MAKLVSRLKRRGLAAVEMAIVLPLLLLLTFGILEYGWMFYKVGQVNDAARRGARVAVRSDAKSADVTNAVTTDLSNCGLAGSGYTLAINPGDVSAVPTGQLISVTITVPYSHIALLGAGLLPMPDNLKASVTMAKEGP